MIIIITYSYVDFSFYLPWNSSVDQPAVGLPGNLAMKSVKDKSEAWVLIGQYFGTEGPWNLSAGLPWTAPLARPWHHPALQPWLRHPFVVTPLIGSSDTGLRYDGPHLHISMS